MDKIRNILLVILIIQVLIFLAVKLIYEPYFMPITDNNRSIALETLIEDSVNEIVKGEKTLPQSSEYTVWDKEMIAKLNEEIKHFNDEMKKIVNETVPLKYKENTDDNKTLKIAKVTKTKEAEIKKQEVKTEKIKQKKSKPKISVRKKVEKYAKGKLGQKYVWGATGPNSFDCSGFTRDVFLCTTGIKIPRVSRDQAKVGMRVEYDKLQRGDMVFFDTEKKYTGKVNHVGIYLSNGNFIHASSARKKVIITNFKKKPFYKKRFLWGRRIVKPKS